VIVLKIWYHRAVGSLVSSLGFNPASNLSVFLFWAIFTFAVVTILWVVGLSQGNHSMMDGWCGFAYAAPAVLAYLITGAQSVTAALLLFMVMLRGGRLGWYLAARSRRHVPKYGGDPRHLNFVNEMSPGYWWESFFRLLEPTSRSASWRAATSIRQNSFPSRTTCPTSRSHAASRSSTRFPATAWDG
jgi:hypothetical protein